MSENIKIDIVSDIVCPWCAIGYKRLEKAISEMELESKIEIEWQPFELDPVVPTEGENLNTKLARRFGGGTEEVQRSIENVTRLGAGEGFKFDFFDDMRIVNTRNFHVLNDYAKQFNKQTDLNMRLVTAYFSERKDISNTDVLTAELESLGLNSDEALAKMDDDSARYEIKSKEDYWHSLGVNSVPTMIFNNKYKVTGAQSVEVYKQLLTELAQQEN